MELDHVLIAVGDLAAAGREMEARHGLTSIEGGRHPAWGTANRIVPLGASYLELVAVVDAVKAAESVFGRWVASGAGSDVARPLGWAVRTSRLDAVAQRLRLSVHPGSRATPGGEQLRWRTAGLEQAAAEHFLPFFIEWEPQTTLPGQAQVKHRAGTARIAGLVVSGDAGRLASWLDNHLLPIVVHPGKPGLTTINISGDSGDISISAADR